LAQRNGKQYPLWIRVAGDGETIYLDLANENGQVIKITTKGWEVIDDPPIKFRRPAGMDALPVPVRGGTIQDLRSFVNLEDEDWAIFLGTLLMMYNPNGPYPVTVLTSEYGSGKTSLAEIMKDLIDPSTDSLAGKPKTADDLIIAASNSWCVGYDNLSTISQEVSDIFCRFSTGGGARKRKLYTDRDEEIFKLKRPLILTGVTDIATQSDLLDRCVFLRLLPITEDKRLPYAEFRARFNEARPRILGALLEAVVVALRNLPTIKPKKLPPLGDFAKFVTAAEPALGVKNGEFIEAYNANRAQADEIAMETSTLVGVLVRYMIIPSTWEGTAGTLLTVLHDLPYR